MSGYGLPETLICLDMVHLRLILNRDSSPASEHLACNTGNIDVSLIESNALVWLLLQNQFNPGQGATPLLGCRRPLRLPPIPNSPY